MTWERGDWMQTFTGRAFHPLAPVAADIDPVDIAHALSMLCRYGGHTRRFYSVAEHCVLMSQAVEPQHALWALLHDATEAYVGDVIRPIKHSLPAYVEIEDRLMLVIAERFNIEPHCPAAVKRADTGILHDERAAVLGPRPRLWADEIESVEPLGVVIQAWAPEHAEAAYMRRLGELVPAETLAA